MKQLHFPAMLLLLLLIMATTSCSSQDKSSQVNKKSNNNSNQFSKPKTSTANFTEGKDYTLFERARVSDKQGFAQPVEAFSVLIPKGWKYDGNIIWTPPGSTCAGTNQTFTATSADGKYKFEMLPYFTWSFNTDPQLAQFNQQYGNSQYCSYGEPMDAEKYLKNVFAPQELNNPTIIEIKSNKPAVENMQQMNEKARMELTGYGASEINFYPSAIYAKVKWSNGDEGIVLCGVDVSEMIIPNVYNGAYNKIYTSTATERVVFKYPASESDKATDMLSVIMSSVRTNTTWKSTVDNFWLAYRKKKQAEHIGKLKLMDEQAQQIGRNAIAKGQQRLNEMDNNMRNWEASQQTNDRIHTNFIKAIREVETYRDETGVVELNSGYDHAWSRSDGSSYIMTNNPNFDPSSVFLDQRWKEMKRVDK
jgi:hypothetical protein